MILCLYFILNVCPMNQFFFLNNFIIVSMHLFNTLLIILYNNNDFFDCWNIHNLFFYYWSTNHFFTNLFNYFIFIDYNWLLRNNLYIFRNFNYLLLKAFYLIHFGDLPNYRDYLLLNYCNLLYSFFN